MVLGRLPSLVNTGVYGTVPSGSKMTDQLSAKDWLDQGLKTLSERGFTALKAEPLAKALGVSRGSFYWHFADVGAFHTAILKHWREVAAEQIIANLEAASDHHRRQHHVAHLEVELDRLAVALLLARQEIDADHRLSP